MSHTQTNHNNNLVVLNNQPPTPEPEGGLGIDFSSKLFALKPATLNIIQQNSNVEGKKGSLRISETGDLFTEMDVVLLATPQERRNYYSGEAGQMNKLPENLLCFTRDMIRPDANARFPQAQLCAGCKNADWKAWQDYKAANNGATNKALAPQCEAFYYAVVLDTQYRLPLQLFIRGKSRQPFELGMNNLSRTLKLAKAQGRNPNIYDVQFKIKTKQITTGKFVSYVYDFSNFTFVTPENRAAFGEIYAEYVAQVKEQAERRLSANTNPYDDDAPGTTGPTNVYDNLEYVEGEDIAA